jgi:hypothetical protein
MKVSFILFIVGLIFLIMGYANQLKPSCKERVTVKYVPRHVYDEIHHQSPDFASFAGSGSGFSGYGSDADPCLEHDYAVANYSTCCANNGYKLDGHKDVCKGASKEAKASPP